MSQSTTRVADGSGRNELLAERFVTLADTLVDDYDVVELLDMLIETCVELLQVPAAGLLLRDEHGVLQPVAYTSEEMRLLELFQLQSSEGPCLDCVTTGEPITENDLRGARGRWPSFSDAAVTAGFQSVHALPLRLRSQTIGGLNLFSSESTVLSEADTRIAQALADVATIGILQQRSVSRASLVAEQLQTALNTRIVIEQAKGVLAEAGGTDMTTAFTRLRGYARGRNQLLGAVASSLVDGALSPDQVLRDLDAPT